MKKYNKLVRDRMPEIIEADGKECKTRILTDDIEYEQALWTKLEEEVYEFFDNPVTDEAADVVQVMKAIMAHRKTNQSDLNSYTFSKAAEKGGFSERVFLESVEDS